MPNTPPPEVRQLKEILQNKVLPFVENGAPIILFDDPPRCLTPFDMQERPTPPLPDVAIEAYPHVQRWRAERLNALSAPMFGCVFDGEADYRVHTPPHKAGAEWTLNLKKGTLFMVAPGTPFSDGSKVAWERSEPQKAYSRAVLMQLRPEGVICHSFTCDKGKLWLHPFLFVYDFEILPLGEKMLDEMHREHPSLSVVALYWQLMLRLLIRTIGEGDVSVLKATGATSSDFDHDIGLTLQNLPVVRLAEEYIKSHLDKSDLNVSAIALHVGLSERHLNRLFKDATGLTLSAYIDQKRLEKARVLLQHSRLTVSAVASYCGFIHLSHFTTWFSRHTHQSPREYRQEMERGIYQSTDSGH